MILNNFMDKNFLKQAIQESKIRSLESSRKGFPSLHKMAFNLGGDVVKTVKNVVSGQSLKSNDEEANKRKDICNTCDFFNKTQERCTKCGCFMSEKCKLPHASCPVGKWGPVTVSTASEGESNE